MTGDELLNFLLEIEERALSALDDTQVDAISLQTFRVRELRHLLGKIDITKIGGESSPPPFPPGFDKPYPPSGGRAA